MLMNKAEKKTTIEVDEELFNDLIQLLKDSKDEGNCFAAMIAQKYGIS